MAKRAQTLNEEVANYITHGLGIVFSLVAVPMMIMYAWHVGNVAMIWAVSIFGFGMLMVYSSSTFYHRAKNAETKKLLQIWDHISIFLMIAGSYTPLVIKYTQPHIAILFLGSMWALVAIGSVLKIFYTGRYNILSVIIFLVLGWMAVLIIKPIVTNMPPHIFYLILAAGFAYTFGVVFYLWHKLQYHHAIWHVFVLTGTIAHFFAVYNSIPINIKL